QQQTLVAQSTHLVRIAEELLAQQLDHDLAMETSVSRDVDLGDAAAREAAAQLVAVVENHAAPRQARRRSARELDAAERVEAVVARRDLVHGRHGATVPLDSVRSSTRRFSARPSALWLLAIGWLSP